MSSTTRSTTPDSGGAPAAATRDPSAASASPSAPASSAPPSARDPGTVPNARIHVPAKWARYRRRFSSAIRMPSVTPSISSSQPAPVPKPLITMRTTQVPPERAATSPSVASRTGGALPPPGRHSSCAKRRGGSQPRTTPEPPLPAPKGAAASW